MVSSTLNTNNAIHTESVGDSVTAVYIPFVREAENDVNASLIIKMQPSDTTFKFIYDWQYNDSTLNETDRLKLPLTLMNLSNSVFGNRMFKILDTTAFPVVGGKASYVKLNSNSSNSTNAISTESIWVYTLTLCYTWYEPINEGQVVGCSPGADCPFYREVTACHTFTMGV